jgi:hypothetical protein
MSSHSCRQRTWDPACPDDPFCAGDRDSRDSALWDDSVAAAARGGASSDQAANEEPGAPSAGEIHYALKTALLEFGDCAEAKFADTFIGILRQRSLDLKLFRGGIDSIAPVRQRYEDDAKIWLQGMHIVERNIAGREVPRTTGVAWLRFPVEC